MFFSRLLLSFCVLCFFLFIVYKMLVFEIFGISSMVCVFLSLCPLRFRSFGRFWFGRQHSLRSSRDCPRALSLSLNLFLCISSNKQQFVCFSCVNVMKSTFQLKPFCIWKKAECVSLPFSDICRRSVMFCVHRFPPLYCHQV